jgi:exosortase
MHSADLIKMSTKLGCRDILFLLLSAVTVAWFWDALVSLFTLSIQSTRYQHYSHIVLIPFLSLYLIYHDRTTIFKTSKWNPWLGSILIMAGVAVSWPLGILAADQLDPLSSVIFGMVMVCWGVFTCCYGTKALREAWFGLFFLLAMVPVPSFVLEPIVATLQYATAACVDFLFQFISVPVFRQGLLFSLPNVTIEIAEECSGIRSSFALLICTLVIGRFFLQSLWTRLALIIAVAPLTILKNAVRIVGLSLLANDVDSRFLTDSMLHRSGGIPLFFLSFMILLGILYLLCRVESVSRQNEAPADTA